MALLNSAHLDLFLWSIVQQLTGAVLTPYMQALINQLNSATPLVPLSPADAAALVVRGEWTEAQAATEARLSGVAGDRFHALYRLSGDAPGPLDLAVALRRGIIDATTYERGIREGRLRTEWSDTIKALAVQEPSPVSILNALLEGQLDRPEAERLYRKLGGAPEYFDILFNTQGSAPTPLEAAEMARRGVIPWTGTGPQATSFEQAFLEGPWRNKWMDPYRTLATYLPPPRTITAMYREGSLSKDDAAKYLAQQGLPPPLVAAYLTSGSTGKTEGSKDLALSTIRDLYRDQLISRTDAADMLTGLGYDATEADYVLQVEDLRVAQRFLGLAVSRVHSLYVGHKIDKAAALGTLAQLQLDADRSATLMGIWDWERAADVKALTAAELWGAVKAKLIDVGEAMARLIDMGYTPRDAWLYLSIHYGGPIDGTPPTDDTGPVTAA